MAESGIGVVAEATDVDYLQEGDQWRGRLIWGLEGGDDRKCTGMNFRRQRMCMC